MEKRKGLQMKQLLIITGVFVVAALFYHQNRQIQSYKDTAQLQAVELSMLFQSLFFWI